MAEKTFAISAFYSLQIGYFYPDIDGAMIQQAIAAANIFSLQNASVIIHGAVKLCSEFPAHRPVTQSLDDFFDLRLNKRLRKQSWGWWFETLSCPLWRHCNGSLSIGTGSRENGISQLERALHHIYNIFSNYLRVNSLDSSHYIENLTPHVIWDNR